MGIQRTAPRFTRGKDLPGATALFLALLLSLGLGTARSQSAATVAASDPSTIKGKVLFGYQGWFDCPGTWGGSWSHWAGGAPSATSISVEMYPDLSDFPKSDLCVDANLTVNGASSYFFSARNPNVTDMHFKWMQNYGLDGVLIQRFLSDVPGLKSRGDQTLKNIIASSAKYGRVIAIEYDVTGSNFNTWATDLENDWKYLVDNLKITGGANYLHEKGRPLVSVWGIGLNESRNPPNTPAEAMTMVNWFHTTAAAPYQASIMAGAPAGFRTGTRDARPDPGWLNVWKACEVVQPWNVGRISSVNQAKTSFKTDVANDQKWLEAAGVTYMPVLYPGYSFNNANKAKPKNEIPRMGGNFIWQMAIATKAANVGAVKIAMFDEVNEATAMFKVAAKKSDAPAQGWWLTLDADGGPALPSDWYLRIAGEITKMTSGRQVATDSIPIKPGDAYIVGVNPALRSSASASKLRWDRVPQGLLFHLSGARGELQICTMKGQALRHIPAQGAQAIWDLRDDRGAVLPPGLYPARFVGMDGNSPAGNAGLVTIP
ncbi:MAG: hypothetical protein JWO30_4689 [Fibrobacteres bacterium]|nr:hypothetical protein [Fibrobacterota bacterium]